MRFSFLLRTPRRFAALGLGMVTAWLITFWGLSSVAAQSSAMDEADKKAFVDYRLTLEKVDKICAVCKKIVEASRTDPQIGKELQAIKSDRNGTFEEIDALFGKQAPHLLALIKSEGLDAREYMLGLLSMMFAKMAVNMKASGATELPDFVPPANVELAEKNKAKFDEADKAIADLNSLERAGGL